ncbi:uncharacterized protein LOC110097611 [Dendrobium catenatum]|uniref:uncharacterized protein LOC110097611 n=1 Tax=Dendrobium catenatum TaxID=906689 RepID=UPI0009F23F21|nr:uncharacterized protein LOC110097611 [Dendrobium catenatum]
MELRKKLLGKSISALIREESVKEEADMDPYSWIHKLNLNARMKLFIWRICKGAVPTTDFLVKRKLAESNICPRGCGEVENVDHVTTICSKLLKHCMEKIKSLSMENPVMVKIYCSLLWHLWSNRNMSKHGKNEDSDIVITTSVLCFVIGQSYGLFSDLWHPPPLEWYKINIDALLKNNYGAGIGGIVRDDKGRFVRAFCIYGVH